MLHKIFGVNSKNPKNQPNDQSTLKAVKDTSESKEYHQTSPYFPDNDISAKPILIEINTPDDSYTVLTQQDAKSFIAAKAKDAVIKTYKIKSDDFDAFVNALFSSILSEEKLAKLASCANDYFPGNFAAVPTLVSESLVNFLFIVSSYKQFRDSDLNTNQPNQPHKITAQDQLMPQKQAAEVNLSDLSFNSIDGDDFEIIEDDEPTTSELELKPQIKDNLAAQFEKIEVNADLTKLKEDPIYFDCQKQLLKTIAKLTNPKEETWYFYLRSHTFIATHFLNPSPHKTFISRKQALRQARFELHHLFTNYIIEPLLNKMGIETGSELE